MRNNSSAVKERLDDFLVLRVMNNDDCDPVVRERESLEVLCVPCTISLPAIIVANLAIEWLFNLDAE